MIKDDLKQEILSEMSEELASFLDTGEGEGEAIPVTFGTVEDVQAPTDVDSAILTIGLVNANFNNAFLVPLSGFPFAEVLMKLSMLNPVLRGILLSSLEVAAAVTSSRIVMLNPLDGATYYGAVTMVSCRVSGAMGVSVSTADDNFDLAQNQDGDWEGLWAFPIGTHTIVITATYETGEEEDLTVDFAVVLWPTYPVSGEAYASPLERLEVSTGADTDNVTSASISIAGETYQLIKGASAWVWEEAVDLIAGDVEAVLNITLDGETIEDILYFTIHEG